MSLAHAGPDERLDSWKEIAAYLKKAVRTVQRWEQSNGLPVHRLDLDRSACVYAYKAEIDAWWEHRRAFEPVESPGKSAIVNEIENGTGEKANRSGWLETAWPGVTFVAITGLITGLTFTLLLNRGASRTRSSQAKGEGSDVIESNAS